MRKIICCMLVIGVITSAQAQNIVYDANAQVRNVGNFHGVSIGGGIVLYLSQGKTQAVAVSSDDSKYTDRIITEVKNGVLQIHIDGKMWNSVGNKKLKAYVTVTNLDYLEASGGSIAKLADEISVDNISTDASGGSIIEGKFKGNKINADLSGGSIVKLEGSFDYAKIEASGGSIFKDYTLAVVDCDVEASGSSIITLTVNKTLKADASGGSIINYMGAGVITSVEASGGSIIKKKDS